MEMNKEKQNDLHVKIPLLINELNERLIERDELSRLVVLAMLSKSHMFLIGERGVAKSMTVELINGVIEGSKFWQLQVNKNTKQEELFGEKRSDEDGTISYTSKKNILNTHFAVLDEMFKADESLLNCLLELLVDGCYTSGDGIKKPTPLLACFGTSNEYPTETHMLPYVDRFPVWYEVKRIQDPDNRKKYYAGDYVKVPIENQYFSLSDIDFIALEKDKIVIPDFIIEYFDSIVTTLITQKVKTSDRKYERVLHGMIKVSAYLNNREFIDISDLFLLLHTSWHDDVEKEKVHRVVFEEIFGNKEEINSLIVKASQDMEDADTYKNGSIYVFLNYQEKNDGTDNDTIYRNVLTIANNALVKYKKIRNEVIDMIKKYQDNILIERLLHENLFVFDYKQNAFTDEMLVRIDTLKGSIEKRIYELSEWIEENPTLFEYQNNLSQKPRGGKDAA
ncbi:AAA family ATPase [Sulfurospirillum multivorans]|uniref:MoxR-like ATPase n=2 Tax=Sulfurospirillum multivorans TaxID=66821 RepID=A0AA86DZY0_SULMK|nr:AAA family ATPase [Sulfurospirillum multivorans]AHJ12990.1 putative MoxR-like ATPase [Sulfurospirillum multivorans DSM 12446]QEH06480.1 putative MoxR-like ATPase [Sulfurospirillum multivorans]